MQQQAAAAEANLEQMGNMKAQIDSMFEQGYIFKNEDGSLGLTNSEEQRKFMAESASKMPKSEANLNFMEAQPQPGGVNLEEHFNNAAGNGNRDDVEY